jgi:NADH-quinone oxidoreductase subunit A
MGIEGSVPPLWALFVYLAAVLVVVAAMIGISAVLGERHADPQTGETYESGILPSGSARSRFTIKFYLVAVSFVVFDLEAAFIFAWALAARQLGWPGYAEMFVFVMVLFCALVYLWKRGALDWGPRPRTAQKGGGATSPRTEADGMVDQQTR